MTRDHKTVARDLGFTGGESITSAAMANSREQSLLI